MVATVVSAETPAGGPPSARPPVTPDLSFGYSTVFTSTSPPSFASPDVNGPTNRTVGPTAERNSAHFFFAASALHFRTFFVRSSRPENPYSIRLTGSPPSP